MPGEDCPTAFRYGERNLSALVPALHAGVVNMRMLRSAGVVMLILCCAAACTASQPADTGALNAPGFLLGLWHGVIAPFAFLASIFMDNVRIYSVPNSGVWYDLGFMLGIGGFSGGALASSKRRAK